MPTSLLLQTSCLGGGVQQYLLHEDYEGAKAYALKMAEIFGEGNFYLELQDHGIEDQQKINNLDYLETQAEFEIRVYRKEK